MNKLRLGSEYIPLVDEEISKMRVVIPFPRVAWFTVTIPFLAFIFCVAWSLMYNFESSTSTHCMVYNLLPSISAAIGHYKPQSNVWKTAISIQAVTRLLVYLLYHRYYKEHIYKWAQGLTGITLSTYVIENISLISLSFWTSNESYAIHKISFILFLIMSFFHMLLSYYIMKNCRNTTRESCEMISMRWKLRSMTTNVVSILLACYCFYRHNKYCEPLVYSMFALCEYAVVLSNMGFHSTAAWDFYTTRIMITGNGVRIF